ncbi:hypothetical protein [Pseudonocardia sp. NPDC046786]|uniref:hypothetical protein n=1 Tax=Pseudonocardia sp. NPDC046786 TaxID=3155471 RepID=UPI0033C54E4A
MSGWNDFGPGRPVGAAEFVAAAGNLLGAALAALGEDDGPGARTDLVDGLAAVLRLDGPYATLRMDTGPAGQPARAELAASAAAASELVLDLVGRAVPEAPARIDDIHSSCVGYAWTPAVVALLLERPGRHAARNLYNEWLWQLVLLRDVLIPFSTPERTRVHADADGLTRLQDDRDRFVVQLMTRRVAHAELVRFAARVSVPDAAVPGAAFGFRTGDALVLPPVALGGPVLGPAHLLEWRTGGIDGLPDGDTVFFVPADAAGDRSGPDADPRDPGDVTVVPIHGRLVAGAPGPAGGYSLDLVVRFDEHEWRADLGRALAGHRYAIRPTGGDAAAAATEAGAGTAGTATSSTAGTATSSTAGTATSSTAGTATSGTADPAAWSGCAVLRRDGAVDLPPGGGVVPTGGQWALTLALLGRLTPGSVVLWQGQDVSAVPDAVLLDLRV